VFRFPLPLFAVGAMQLYPPHAALLHPTLAPWAPELRERAPAFVVLRDGQAVAICACARVSREAAEAGVETAPEFRGQGYAVLAAQAWAAAIAESGRIPFYSTTWENTASRAVAEKLALEEVGEDVWFSP
jgi:predicted GNAT family acetyltransferase